MQACNETFLEEMLDACQNATHPDACKIAANAYHTAVVSKIGQDTYKAAQDQACHTWVKFDCCLWDTICKSKNPIYNAPECMKNGGEDPNK